MSGALALLDRAAALFGTKAAAAERHRATIRRCMVAIGPVLAIADAELTTAKAGERRVSKI